MSNEVISRYVDDDGRFPNNGERPVLVYHGAVDVRPESIESLFASNGWTGSWRNGVFPYHHYHSNTHEVLGCYRGSAQIQLGGDTGDVYELAAGDVVVIPAGVAHKRLSQSPDFHVVGAYPEGRSPDMNYGRDDERPAADSAVRSVPVPESDPVFGSEGPLPGRYREPRE